MTKKNIHRYIKLGIMSIDNADAFIEGLRDYVRETGDPSSLAMTQHQAQRILDHITEISNLDFELVEALRERIRISVSQGQPSVMRKAEIRRHREAMQKIAEQENNSLTA